VSNLKIIAQKQDGNVMQKTIKRSKHQILKQPMKTKAVIDYQTNNISCIEAPSSRNLLDLHKPPPQKLYISHKRR
jgi:hypothetical protein